MKARKLLGKRIRELRKQAGLSMEALAVEAGVNDKYLGSIERGMQAATIDTIEKISAGLGVEVHELLVPREESAKVLRGKVNKLLLQTDGRDLQRVVAVLEAMLH